MLSELYCTRIVHFYVAATMKDAENRSCSGSPSSLDLSYSSSCFEGSNDSYGNSEVDDAHQGPSGSAVEPYKKLNSSR